MKQGEILSATYPLNRSSIVAFANVVWSYHTMPDGFALHGLRFHDSNHPKK